jgi:ADP-ribosyl-[dinitrogen reductase] hydrolase
VVEAFQGAWSAITMTSSQIDDPTAGLHREHLALGLEAAVRGGRDTDTVAAIAGALLGGAHGASAVPAHWRDLLHGWPGMTAADLTDLATAITGQAQSSTAEAITGDRIRLSFRFLSRYRDACERA